MSAAVLILLIWGIFRSADDYPRLPIFAPTKALRATGNAELASLYRVPAIRYLLLPSWRWASHWLEGLKTQFSLLWVADLGHVFVQVKTSWYVRDCWPQTCLPCRACERTHFLPISNDFILDKLDFNTINLGWIKKNSNKCTSHFGRWPVLRRVRAVLCPPWCTRCKRLYTPTHWLTSLTHSAACIVFTTNKYFETFSSSADRNSNSTWTANLYNR